MNRLAPWILLSCVIVTSEFSSASADVTVWFELVGSDAGVTALDSGPGEALLLSDPGESTLFTITVRMRGTYTGSNPIFTSSTDLSANYGVSVIFANPVAPPGGISWVPTGLGVPGPGDIIQNFGGATFTNGYSGVVVDFGTISLLVDPLLGDYRGGQIFGRVGPRFWGDSTISFVPVRFGSGDFVSGGNVGAGKAPMIQFIPEPTLVSLLLMGIAPVLVRRRRSV